MATVTIKIADDTLAKILQEADSVEIVSDDYVLACPPIVDPVVVIPPSPEPVPEPTETEWALARATNLERLAHGINIRAATQMPPALLSQTLDEAAAVGFKNLRFYAPGAGWTTQESIDRGGAVLDAAAVREISVSVVMNDMAGSFHHVPGTQPKDGWFKYGYLDNYIPFIHEYLTAFGNHPALFCVETGNEMQTRQFVTHDVAHWIHGMFSASVEAVREVAPHLLVTSGSQTTWHTFVNQTKDHWRDWMSLFDFQTGHSHFDILYGWSGAVMGGEDGNVRRDIDRASSIGQKLVLGELGCLRTNHQHATPYIQAAIEAFIAAGGAAVWQWEFSAGDSDGFGMAPWFDDWGAMKTMWKSIIENSSKG